MNKYININLCWLKSLRVSITHSDGWEFLLYLLVQLPHLERIELEMVKREDVRENRRFIWNPQIGVTAKCKRETKVNVKNFIEFISGSKKPWFHPSFLKGLQIFYGETHKD
ncbi:unnamed protein product [Prunus brigantina]